MTSFIEGVYVHKADEKSVETMIKLGVAKEEAEKILGIETTFTISKLPGENRWMTMFSSSDNPDFNWIGAWTENVEGEMDHPLMGGKAKITFKRINENTFLDHVVSPTFGTCEATETYEAKGVLMKSKHEATGEVFTEFWSRKIKETGWFRITKDENLTNFMIKSYGLPKELASVMKDYKVKVEKDGDSFIWTEVIGGKEVVTKYKLDEECDYLTGNPEMDRKLICTRIDNGKYKMILKGSKGQHEEWDITYGTNGVFYEAKDMKSGETGKAWAESFINFCGTFKPIKMIKFDEFASALGVPAEISNQMANEEGAKMIISDHGDGFYNFKYESKICPLSASGRFNEEYEIDWPIIPGEKFTCITSICENVIINTMKAKKCTIVVTDKVTENFVIEEISIAGTPIVAKVIYERV